MTTLTLHKAKSWRKATSCHANGTCVEIAADGNTILFRDAKNPAGPQLQFDRPELRQFITKVKTR